MNQSSEYHSADIAARNLLDMLPKEGIDPLHLFYDHEDKEQTSLLLVHIEAALRRFEPKPVNEPKNQFDARIRALKQQQDNSRDWFKKRFATKVICGSLSGEPLILSFIESHLNLIEQQIKIKRIQEIFPYRDNMLQRLLTPTVQQLYIKAEDLLQQIEGVVQQIEAIQNFISTAGIPINLISITVRHEFPLNESDLDYGFDPLDHMIFIFETNDDFPSSAHNILTIPGILPNDLFKGNESNCNEESKAFALNYNQFSILQRNLITWYRDFETVLNVLFSAFEASKPDSFSSIPQRFHVAIQHYLNETMSIQLHPIKVDPDLILTAHEKIALLRNIPQSEEVSRFIPLITDVELDHTVKVLKNSPNYPTLAEAYAKYYSALGAQAKVDGTTTYEPQRIYMYSTLDDCLDKLLSEFKKQDDKILQRAKRVWHSIVMRIVYAEKICTSEAALQRFAKCLGDIFKVDDLHDNLGQGFDAGSEGLFLLLESQLVPGADDPFSQFIKQLLIDEVEQSFNDIIRLIPHETSGKSMVMRELGLLPINRSLYNCENYHLPSIFMRDFSTRYNPGKIYSKCYQYFSDEFKSCLCRGDHNGIEKLLNFLGFLKTDHEQLQTDGEWSIDQFEFFLSKKTVALLVKLNIIFQEPLNVGSLIIEASSSCCSFINRISDGCLAEKGNRLFRPTENQTPSTPDVTHLWKTRGLLLSPPTTTNHGDSKRSSALNRSFTG